MDINNRFIDQENKLIDEMNNSYQKLMDQLSNHKFKNLDQVSNFIQRMGIVSSKINNLNNEINKLYIDLIENQVEINEIQNKEIKLEKQHQKIIKKMLPALLIHSVLDIDK
tara:strand:+ start:16 stop:348 length:333 start_codon:yes stop_codon:yes gene_type:complete